MGRRRRYTEEFGNSTSGCWGRIPRLHYSIAGFREGFEDQAREGGILEAID